VLIVGIISLFVDLPILDPILSLMITAYILVNAISRLRDSAKLFLQGVPDEVDLDVIQQALRDIDGVISIHHTHIWSLDGEHNVFTAHLVVADNASPEIVKRVRKEGIVALQDIELEHVTIAVEYESEECEMRSADEAA
jgi:cobalt-zinc-cadmium efflux system protein